MVRFDVSMPRGFNGDFESQTFYPLISTKWWGGTRNLVVLVDIYLLCDWGGSVGIVFSCLYVQ